MSKANFNLLRSKKVLAICMETTASGNNYSGGLGALYGDTVRTMHRNHADFMAVTPIYKFGGYVKQTISAEGVKDEFPEQNFSDNYIDTGIILDVPMVFRNIKVKVWQNREIPIAYGLDAYIPENGEFKAITDTLYGENAFSTYSGEDQRLMQEVVLGVGSVILAKHLGYNFDVLHLNEGHGVFATVYQISELMKQGLDFSTACQKVRAKTVFTTHTPIAAGNKSYPIDMIIRLGCNYGLNYNQLRELGEHHSKGMFGSTVAALRLSHLANAVAFRHQSTSRDLWKGVRDACPIHYIDNGVDLDFWQAQSIREAYNKGCAAAVYTAHQFHKQNLINFIQERTGVKFDPSHIIIGFGRRVIEYKRADLIFTDLHRFEQLIKDHNIQIVFSGKTHPRDFNSKAILRNLYKMSMLYPNNVVFLQNYDVEVCGYMTKGCDLWLANPMIPLEACSTSGMKAAANGVLNLSTPDGWWAKSCRYSVNGWFIGGSVSQDRETDADYLYKALEQDVLPVYEQPNRWANMMMAAIYTAETECSTDKMIHDYYRLLYNA